MEQEKPLDGGLLAWSTVIGGWVHQLVSSILCLNSSSLLTVAVTFGYTNSFGVYQDLYTRSNTASASAISWIGATVLHFCYGTSRWKTSWYGLLSPHYYCWIHNLCFFVSPLSFIGSPSPHHFRIFMLSICHEDKFYQLYLAQGLGMGIGAGLLYAPSVAVQAHHWCSRRSLAMGIVASGLSASSFHSSHHLKYHHPMIRMCIIISIFIMARYCRWRHHLPDHAQSLIQELCWLPVGSTRFCLLGSWRVVVRQSADETQATCFDHWTSQGQS